MDTLAYILKKYKLEYTPRKIQMSPTEIPNMGRENLPALFRELGFKIGAEIGVDSGRYSLSLCKGIPGVKLFCVDSWKVYAPDYRDIVDQAKMDNAKHGAHERLAPYNVEFIEKFSNEALGHVADNALDFVYIDGNHELPFVMFDIIHWSKKVRSGGIISGHDYYETVTPNSRCHVIPAVLAYTRAYKIVPWFVVGTKAMDPGVIRDSKRSWMWVKP